MLKLDPINAPLPASLLIVLAGFGLAACVTVGPDYKPPATSVPARWSGLEAAALPATQATAPDDLTQWWRRLNDPLLTELVDQARRAAPDLRTAEARLRESRARRGVAASERYPTVNATGNARRTWRDSTAGSGSSNLYSAGFDATWELDVFGGVRRGVEAADANLEAAEARLHDTQVSLSAETALNYVDVRTLQTRVRIARDNLATQTETLQLTEWRAQAGSVSSQDVEQARSQREQTRALIPTLENSLAQAEHRLEVLLGQAPGTLHARLGGAAELPALPYQIAVTIPAEALRQRPDVRAAERTLAAETARVGVAQAARYPAFNLSGSIGLEALTLAGLGDAGAAGASVLGGITAPIFNAGRLRSLVDVQDAVREQALVAYEQTVLAALQEAEDALVALARNRERLEALTLASEAANNAALLARQRYGAGLIDFQSVLDTQRSVLNVEDNLATTRADGVTALIRLYKALGGGWPADAARPAAKEAP